MTIRQRKIRRALREWRSDLAIVVLGVTVVCGLVVTGVLR
jgi:hypothetical protein